MAAFPSCRGSSRGVWIGLFYQAVVGAFDESEYGATDEGISGAFFENTYQTLDQEALQYCGGHQKLVATSAPVATSRIAGCASKR